MAPFYVKTEDNGRVVDELWSGFNHFFTIFFFLLNHLSTSCWKLRKGTAQHLPQSLISPPPLPPSLPLIFLLLLPHPLSLSLPSLSLSFLPLLFLPHLSFPLTTLFPSSLTDLSASKPHTQGGRMVCLPRVVDASIGVVKLIKRHKRCSDESRHKKTLSGIQLLISARPRCCGCAPSDSSPGWSSSGARPPQTNLVHWEWTGR